MIIIGDTCVALLFISFVDANAICCQCYVLLRPNVIS